jgi:hypothetical protein
MADVTIASFHLIEVDPRASLAGLARIGLDRRPLAAVNGLRFARRLGAGRDGKMSNSFQPNRRAMFAVWDDDASLDSFLAGHRVADRWSAARSVWHVRLRLIAGHGAWGGEPILEGLERVDDTERTSTTPVVTVTRASIRPGALVAFGRASRAVTRSLATADGLRMVVGVGELPVARLGTVAVWDDDTSATTTGWTAHADAARSALAHRWFSESLFARFAPYGSTGTWSGVDPTA